MSGQSVRPLPLLLALLVLLTCLHRLAWLQHPPDVDPINFHAALSDYDVPAQRPHAPGYPLFVALGKAAVPLFGRDHAIVAVDWALVLVAAAALYAGMAARGLRREGLAAALLLASHPLTWAATLASESYIGDAAFSCLVFGITGFWRGRPRLLWPALFAALLALGLFRAVSIVLVTPLAIACVVADVPAGRRVRPALAAAGVAALALVLAYGATVTAAGGPGPYREAVAQVMAPAFRGASVLGGAPWQVHAAMLARLATWCLFAAAPWALLLLVQAALRRVHPGAIPAPMPASLRTVLWCWWGAPFAFYALVYYLKPTYQLIYLPALLVGAAWVLVRLPLEGRSRAALLALLVAAPLAMVLAGGRGLPDPLQRLSWSHLRAQERATDELLRFAAGLDRQHTLVVWAGHPRLSPFALRLLGPGVPTVVVGKAADGPLEPLDPWSMRWQPPLGDALPWQGITQLLIVATGAEGRPSLQMQALAPGTVLDAALLRSAVQAARAVGR